MTAAAIAEVHKEKIITPPAKPEALPPLDANSASQNISVWLILRSPFNRKPEVDDDFVANIRENGVIQPIIVRRVKLGLDRINELPASTSVAIGSMVYELVAGERRWLAAKKANRHSIPAVIRELTDVQAMKIQIAENEHRQDYSILDRSEAYARLRNEYMQQHKGEKGWTEEKCMDLIAVDCKNDKIKGRTVQQIIALGKLTLDCQAALRKGEMEQSHAYEFSRLSVQDQAELLLWLRQQTHHSQGDIPSVRRLKLEIRNMEQQREAEKRQPLFQETEKKESGAGAKLTFDGKTIELAPGQLPGSVRTPLLRIYPELNTAFFLKDGRIQLSLGLTGTPFYMGVAELQKLLSAKALHAPAASAQTLAPEVKTVRAGFAGTREVPVHKPQSEAQIKRAQKEREKEQERFQKQRAADLRNSRIEKQYSVLLFVALAKKAHVCSRLLSHIIPGMLFEMWEQGGSAILLEAFAPEVMGWPKPRDGEYSYAEVKEYSERHTRKFTGNLLSALLITQQLGTPKAEQLAKYFSIDPKRLRQKATAAVKQEDAAAKKQAKGQGPKAGVKA